MEWLNALFNIIKKGASLRWRSFLIVPILAVILTACISWFSIHHIYHRPYPTQDIDITVEKGTSTWQILTTLNKLNVLPHPAVTLATAVLSGHSIKIMAGEYRIQADMSPAEIMEMFRDGQVIERTLTLPEGLTTHEIVHRIQQDVRFKGVTRSTVTEGSLFPSTYHLKKDQDRTEFLEKMARTMHDHAKKLMKRNKNPFLRTPHDLITFASILEKEAATAEELPRISGVFVNRLKKGMRLQSCPTVMYAITLGQQKFTRALTYNDLKIESPYNTYLIDGLPKGPICCPGLKAMEAAIAPLKTDELYFIYDGNQHHFSITYKEHLDRKRNIQTAVKDIQ